MAGATRSLVRWARLAGVGLLGLVAALALGSCGGDGEVIGTGSIGTGSITRSISVPTVTESVTVTAPGAAVTETVTLTESAPGAGESSGTPTIAG